MCFQTSFLIHFFLKLQRISKLHDRIGKSDLYRQFSTDLIPRINSGNSLIYDITSVPSHSSDSILEYSHAKDHLGKKQVNISIVTEKENGIPVIFDRYPGIIVDVSTLKNTIARDRAFGMGSVSQTLGKSLFSLDNLSVIKGIDFIKVESLFRKEIKGAFSAIGKKMENTDSVIVHSNSTIFVTNSGEKINGMDIDIYFYHDSEREGGGEGQLPQEA